MNVGWNSTETEADVERAWVALLLDKQVDDSMHTKTSENECGNHGNAVEVVMKTARSKMKGLIAKKGNRAYAERTQGDVQSQIEETLVDIYSLEMVPSQT